MGVNRRVINLGQDPTYENSKVALNDFWERTIVPMRRRHASTLSSQLLPLFGLDPAQYRLRFDFSDVEALRENLDALHARWRETFAAGGIDLFTFQEKIGLKPDEKYRGRYVKASAAFEEAESGDEIKARPWNESDHERASDGRFGSVAGNHGGRGSSASGVGGIGADGPSNSGVAGSAGTLVSGKKKKKPEADSASVAPHLLNRLFTPGLKRERIDRLIEQLPETGASKYDAETARQKILELHNAKDPELDKLKKRRDAVNKLTEDLIRSNTKDKKRLDILLRQQKALIDEVEAREDEKILEKWQILFANESPSFDLGKYKLNDNLTAKDRKTIESGAKLASRLIGRPLPESLSFNSSKAERPDYNHSTQTINVTKKTNSDDIVHELGHWMESHDAETHRRLVDFLDKRSVNPDPSNPANVEKYTERKLKEVFENSNYKEDEKTITDELVHGYIGKIYPGKKYTEVLTMGMQYFVTGPEILAEGDPEMFNLVYDILRGK